MIRHAAGVGGAAGAIFALLITMILAACVGLLMAAIGGTALPEPCLLTTRQTAIDLPAFAGGTDEEDDAAGTTALPKRSGTNGMHFAYGRRLDSTGAPHGECAPLL